MAARHIANKVWFKKFEILPLILSLTSMVLGSLSQDAAASTWAAEKFAIYQSHPDWISTRCQNMEKVNQKGLSNFSEKVALLEKQYNPNFAGQTVKEIVEFYRLFGRKFCSSAW